MPQYTFSAKPELIKIVDELAGKITPKPSRSEMIVVLLESAIRQRTRTRKPKQDTDGEV